VTLELASCNTLLHIFHAMENSRLDRMKGCLLGLLVGDAVGTALENVYPVQHVRWIKETSSFSIPTPYSFSCDAAYHRHGGRRTFPPEPRRIHCTFFFAIYSPI
jgi:hypothetical protein